MGRRRRSGNSIVGCLLFFALTMFVAVWGYFKFYHYRNLVNAGHNHITFKHRVNWSAYLEYGRRFRGGFKVTVAAMTSQNYNMVQRYKKGAFTNHSDLFYAETQAYIDLLLDSVTQLDAQQVPEVLERAHIDLSRAHGLCYETVLELRLAHETEGAERANHLRNAQKYAEEASKTGNRGIADMERAWANTKT